jgi:hypothetical protein
MMQILRSGREKPCLTEGLAMYKDDGLVKNQKSDGKAKSSRCKARKSEGVKRT